MKRLFVCEWCGKIFDNEQEVKQCERSHRVPLNVVPCTYREGDEIPEIVKVTFDSSIEGRTYEENYRRIGWRGVRE